MNMQLGPGRVHVPHVPTAERRMPYHPFRIPQHTANSLRQHGCGRHCQARKVGAARVPQCAASSVSPASGKRSAEFGIDVKAEPQSKSHVQLTVTLPPQLVKKAYDKALNSIKKEVDLPGYRKGSKVPTETLLKFVEGGKPRLKQLAIEDLLQMTLPTVMSKYEGIAIDESLHIDTPSKDLVAVFDETKGLQYQVGIDLSPQVAWKSSYRDISVTVEAAGSEEEDRAAVERMLQALRKEKGTLRVASRALQAGDVVIVDFDAARTEGDDGEPILGAKRDNMRVDTETADRDFMPGLVDGMLGMKVGDERTFTVTLPQTWEPSQLRGVRADCTVKAKEVFEWQLPELTDDFVRENIKMCNDLADARERLFEAQQLRTAEGTMHRTTNALSEAVGDIVEAEVPQSMLRQIGEQEYQTKLLDMQREGKIAPQVLEQLANEQLMEAFIKEQQDSLEKIARSFLGFDAIIQKEGLAPSDAEVTEEYEKGAQSFKDAGQDFDAGRLREQAAETVKAGKVLEFLQKTCTINTTPFSGSELSSA